MKEQLEKVVRETNRVLFTWLRLHKDDPRFTITEMDVKAVFNGWFIRFLKSHFGYSECSRILRYARPLVLLADGQICAVRLMSYDDYRVNMNNNTKRIMEVFGGMDYKSLYFTELDLIKDEQDQEHQRNLLLGDFDPSIVIDFTKLKNIQFV